LAEQDAGGPETVKGRKDNCWQELLKVDFNTRPFHFIGQDSPWANLVGVKKIGSIREIKKGSLIGSMSYFFNIDLY
jgi:hypothetical protein